MDTAFVKRSTPLRTAASHVRSGQVVHTDAPVDNRGRGEAFSPTDLLATSLACCMITTLEIRAVDEGVPLGRLEARVVKHMTPPPRRVGKVAVFLWVEDLGLTEEQRNFVVRTVHQCPVALSLHPDLEQAISITFEPAGAVP
jgi:uncharacterized OsmC-like protein